MTDYDFTLTRDEIIESAFSKAGVIGEGESITSAQNALGVKALNVIVKSWQNHATFPWTQVNISLPLVQDDKDYDMSSYYLVDLFKVELKYDNREIPMEIESYADYHDTYDKTDTGRPSCVALHRVATPTLYVYPAPDRSSYYTLEILGVKRNKDLETGTAAPEFESRWYKAMIYQLAADIADDYQVSMSKKQWLEEKAIKQFKFAKTGNNSTVTRRSVRSAY